MRLAIDGNIAAGKSTVFSSIAMRPGITSVASLFPEPLDEWGEILELYFQDRQSWALPLTLDILRGFHKPYETQHAVVERNPYTCRYVFTEMLKYDGVLSHEDMALVDQYMDMFGWKPDAVIYLDETPATCHERMEHRNRPGETDGIDYDELRMISHMYDKMFRDQLSDVPLYRVRKRDDESKEAYLDRVGELIEQVLAGTAIAEPSRPKIR
jgi:deoxyadenosine/deoxycytidine kinase